VAVYAIGDIQGCFDELKKLLDVIAFDAERDVLWFTGDLVNRGPKSLEVLRFVKNLGEHALTVLGNHDLHLLAVTQGHEQYHLKDTFDDVLAASDRAELVDWLRRRPLLHHDAAHDAYSRRPATAVGFAPGKDMRRRNRGCIKRRGFFGLPETYVRQ